MSLTSRRLLLSGGSGSATTGHWLMEFADGSNDCIGRGIAVDTSGNVYSVGDDQGTNTMIVAKFNSSGIIQWQRGITIGGSGNNSYGIAVDQSSNVYIVGSVPITFAESIVVKFDTNGNLLWQRSLGGASNDNGLSISLDSAANVYIAGNTASQGFGNYDMMVAKYNTLGAIQWQKVLGGANVDIAFGVTTDSISSGLVALSPATIATSTAPFAITISADGTSVYITNNGGNTVSQYSRNTSTGLLTALSPATVATGSGPVGITISADGTSVYITNQTSNNISQYSRNTSTGLLAALGTPTIATGINPYGITISSDGTFVYAVNGGSSTISQYSRNPGTGLLTTVGTIATGSNPIAITISVDGISVYAVNQTSNSVSQYSRNTSTGVLTSLGTIAAGTTPDAITISTDGTRVYVANDASNTITQYSRNLSTGVLTTLATPTIATGTNPHGIIISNDGASVYATNYSSNKISQYSDIVNIYITGYTASQGAGFDDFIVAKYNAAGTLQWQRILGGTGSESGQGAVIDPTGNVYVVGWTASQGAGGQDVLIAKFDHGSGAILWQRTLGGSGTDIGYGIAIDSSSNLYIVGETTSQGAGGQDVLIAKYNSSGVIQWQRTLCGVALSGNTTEYGTAIAVDNVGNLYINGASDSLSLALTFLIAKLPQDGTLTGTYLLSAGSIIYQASTLTDAASTFTGAAATLSSASLTLTDAAGTLTSTTSSLVSTIKTF